MAVVVGVVSQKGGVGKSTLARLIAREFAANGWNVKIADLDVSQGTSFHWHARRLQNAIEPSVAVERFGTVEQALRVAPNYDLLILDGPPHSTAGTLRIAEGSNLVVLPTGLSLDDLQPSVLLAHEMIKKGIPQSRIVFAICRVGDSESEIEEARGYINGAGYHALPGTIPEKIAYRRASDEGRTLTETRYSSLNERGDQIAQAVADRITAQQKAEVA